MSNESNEPGLPLGYKPQPHPPARPTYSDPRVIEEAAREVMPEVMEWYGPGESEDSLLDDMKAAISEGDDASMMLVFLAKNRGWAIDRDLFDILDSVSLFRHRDALVRQWVAANLIRPAMSIGDCVTHGRHGAGQIVKIEYETACYVVRLNSHIGKTGDGYVGTILPFEECERSSSVNQES